MTPTKISQPRPGSVGSLIAETAVATPRKMKPTAIQMASSRIAVLRMRKHSTARISDAAPLMNSSTRPPADTSQAEREEHLRDAGDQQVGAEEDRRDQERLAGPDQDQNAEDDGENPGHQRRFPQCGNRLGAAVVSMGEVWHTAMSMTADFARTAVMSSDSGR